MAIIRFPRNRKTGFFAERNAKKMQNVLNNLGQIEKSVGEWKEQLKKWESTLLAAKTEKNTRLVLGWEIQVHSVKHIILGRQIEILSILLKNKKLWQSHSFESKKTILAKINELKKEQKAHNEAIEQNTKRLKWVK